MASGAKDLSKRRVVPLQLEGGAEDKDTTAQEISDGVVPTANLPVPKQVEATTPTFPVVEVNDLSSRDDHGSPNGQQNQPTNQQQQQSSPSGAKKDAAKISTARFS